MKINLTKNLEDLHNKNNELVKILDGLAQEKEKQDQHVHDLEEELANERFANKQLVNQMNERQQELNKTKEELNKVKLDLAEEKVVNQQLVDNIRELNPLGTGFFSGRKMIVIIGLSILNQNVPTKPS